jgi:ketosteroid isomerase-like protein
MEEIEKRFRAIEARLQATEDIEAVKQLHYRYMNGFTRADWASILDCFADDATLDVVPNSKPVQGKAAIAHVYEMLSKTHVGNEAELAIHPVISVTGDKAEGNWLMYMMFPITGPDKYLLLVQGQYNARYIKINGVWKFSFLQHIPRPIKGSPKPPIPE